MRRTVATLLVVASPLLMAAPVTAEDGRPAGPVAPAVVRAPAAPEVMRIAPPAAPDASQIAPAVPGAVQLAPPAAPAPVRVAPPATPVPVRVAPPAAPPTARPAAAKAVPPKAAVSEAAYAERLRAELCVARQVFCGLTHDGRYPAG